MSSQLNLDGGTAAGYGTDLGTAFPTTKQSVAKPVGTQVDADAAAFVKSMIAGAVGQSLGSNDSTRTATDNNTTNHQDYYFGKWVLRESLQAQTIASDTWTLAIQAVESNAALNAFLTVSLYVWRPSTNARVGFIYDTDTALGTEFATTQATLSVSFTGAAITVQDGDLLVLEVWATAVPSMASTYTAAVTSAGSGSSKLSTASVTLAVNKLPPFFIQDFNALQSNTRAGDACVALRFVDYGKASADTFTIKRDLTTLTSTFGGSTSAGTVYDYEDTGLTNGQTYTYTVTNNTTGKVGTILLTPGQFWWFQSCDGPSGRADGTAVTVANSDDDTRSTAFNTFGAGSDSTSTGLYKDNAARSAAGRGGVIRFTNGTVTGFYELAYAYYYGPPQPIPYGRHFYYRAYHRLSKIPAAPNFNMILMIGGRASGGDAQGFGLVINTNGTLSVYRKNPANGTFEATGGTSTTVITATNWFRVEIHQDQYACTWEVRLFVGANVDGTTPDETLTGTYQHNAHTTSPVPAYEFWDKSLICPLVYTDTSYWQELDDIVIQTSGWPGPGADPSSGPASLFGTANLTAVATLTTAATTTDVMVYERFAPDAITLETNLTGAVSNIQDDPDSADANWLTAPDATQPTVLTATFPTPNGAPRGMQNIRVRARPK